MEPNFLDAIRAELISRIRTLCSPMEPRSTAYQCQNTLKPPIRAAIFDVYGTLLISQSGDIGVTRPQENGDHMASAFASLDIEIEPGVGEHVAKVFRNTINREHDLARARGIENPEVEIREVWQSVCHSLVELDLLEQLPEHDDILRLAVEYECRANPVWPMTGVAQTLASLGECGLLMGIVSNAQFYTPLAIEALLGSAIEQLGFDSVLCAWSYLVMEAKPGTAMHEQAAKSLRKKGILPRETLYVGNDMLNDIATASEVGFQTTIFAGDGRSLRLREGDGRCAGVRPDASVSSLAELAVILSSM